ncbi:pyridoxal phosphate-dependent aminotransferase [Rhodoflexus sp.]
MFEKSNKLDRVFYEIRGPVYEQAAELEMQGYKITRLNIGNPAPFGFDAPDEIIHDIIVNLRNAQGYVDARGLFAARKAVMHYSQLKAIKGVGIEDIFIGNGVSELILLSMQALLNDGDEILVPAPDYPLWTSAINLSGGVPVHYICDEQADWTPDLTDIERKITSRTKGIVLINPNNPTGAVYSSDLLQQLVALAVRHRLIVFSDEIYDKILYDDTAHFSVAAFSDETLFVTYGGLSKAYRACGFRGGWMILSGDKKHAQSYINGLNTLASMRLCSNVPAQFAIQTALGGYQSINELVLPGGRLRKQRDYCWQRLNQMPGVSCVKPKGAFYMFPKIDTQMYRVDNDQQFVLDLLRQQHLLIVQGSGFNWPHPDHFRIVFLPTVDELAVALDKLENFLDDYRR